MKLSSTRSKVLFALQELGEATDKELAQHMQWPINCVTPRRLELQRMGVVEEAAVVKRNGRNATLWRIA